jgi:hypothetical protein
LILSPIIVISRVFLAFNEEIKMPPHRAAAAAARQSSLLAKTRNRKGEKQNEKIHLRSGLIIPAVFVRRRSAESEG